VKKSPLVLIGILAFTAIVVFINAQESSPTRERFEELLQGSVTQGSIRQYGLWTSIREVITGNGQGDLKGSPITFTIVCSSRSFALDHTQKNFINGTWMFVSSDGSSISGILFGQGTKSNEFSGKFESTQSQKSTGLYSKAKISGEFAGRIFPLPPYGTTWGYEAWWNGTFREGEE